jgi:hypothetical protein
MGCWLDMGGHVWLLGAFGQLRRVEEHTHQRVAVAGDGGSLRKAHATHPITCVRSGL